MHITRIDILGYRGFGTSQGLDIAVPNGKPGSGLTVVVGPNNSGKSTVFEALRSFSQNNPPTITEGRRNKRAGDAVSITVRTANQSFLSLVTIPNGGAKTEFKTSGLNKRDIRIFALQSRRSFEPFFGEGTWDRYTFMENTNLPPIRGSQLGNFFHRIFNIHKSVEQLTKFNSLLSEVMSPLPKWQIEQNDSGQFYIKFIFDDIYHNSDGAGEGLLSLFTIIDSLYDPTENDLVAIDEPELSLHPSLQRRLSELLLRLASSMQIVIFTHSPYFVSWDSVINGGIIARTIKTKDGNISINRLQCDSVNHIYGLLANANNPHILGLDAKEIFFLGDNILMSEGQEDVVVLKRIIQDLGLPFAGNFYGWGAGGATNIDKLLLVLDQLGFRKVFVILDRNMIELANKLRDSFPQYKVCTIPTDNIRDKDAAKAKPPVVGLTDETGTKIKEQYKADVVRMFKDIDEYFLQNA